jgi:hypothetical protein
MTHKGKIFYKYNQALQGSIILVKIFFLNYRLLKTVRNFQSPQDLKSLRLFYKQNFPSIGDFESFVDSKLNILNAGTELILGSFEGFLRLYFNECQYFMNKFKKKYSFN